MSQRPPVVLVNGAWHGAWCWPLLQRELAARGVESYPVEVLGYGGLSGASPITRDARPFDPQAFATERSVLADITLDEVRQRLVEDVAMVAQGRPVDVVSHSVSGLAVAAAIEAAPELFASVTFLAAVVPLLDLTAAAYNLEPEMASSLLIRSLVGDPSVTGAARCDFQGDPERTAETFYADVPLAQQRQAVTMLSTDVPFGIDGSVRVSPTGLGSLPKAYIQTLDDRAVPLAMQERMVREIDRACGGTMPVLSIAASHSPFLSVPDRLAELLVETLSSQGAGRLVR